MANPVGFEGANEIFLAPKGSTPEECCDLEVFTDNTCVISCWRLDPDEREMVAKTGVVWVRIEGCRVTPFLVSGMPQVVVKDPTAEGGERGARAQPFIPRARRKEE